MKKSGILNADLAQTIARLGHGDLLVIGDAGLPVPPGVPCIDLAVTLGTPSMLTVLDAVMGEMSVEMAFRAKEADDIGSAIDERIQCAQIAHQTFKERSARAVAIVRTGEATPYANVGLVAGVAF